LNAGKKDDRKTGDHLVRGKRSRAKTPSFTQRLYVFGKEKKKGSLREQLTEEGKKKTRRTHARLKKRIEKEGRVIVRDREKKKRPTVCAGREKKRKKGSKHGKKKKDADAGVSTKGRAAEKGTARLLREGSIKNPPESKRENASTKD